VLCKIISTELAKRERGAREKKKKNQEEMSLIYARKPYIRKMKLRNI
jgi:hypothetical protein